VPSGQPLPELGIIQLTAQDVGAHGAEPLNGPRSCEENKREFMFVKEAHCLYTFLKRLTDACSSVLLDSRESQKQLHADAIDSSAILQVCVSSKREKWLRSCTPVVTLANRLYRSCCLLSSPPTLA
jgi:hypothetical protein